MCYNYGTSNRQNELIALNVREHCLILTYYGNSVIICVR